MCLLLNVGPSILDSCGPWSWECMGPYNAYISVCLQHLVTGYSLPSLFLARITNNKAWHSSVGPLLSIGGTFSISRPSVSFKRWLCESSQVSNVFTAHFVFFSVLAGTAPFDMAPSCSRDIGSEECSFLCVKLLVFLSRFKVLFIAVWVRPPNHSQF